MYGHFYVAHQKAIKAIEPSSQFQALRSESESVKPRKAQLCTTKCNPRLTSGDVAEVGPLDKKLDLLRQQRFQGKRPAGHNILSQYPRCKRRGW